MSQGTVVMWTLYDHPKDYPDAIVARKWEVTAGNTVKTDSIELFPSVSAARNHFAQHGLVCLHRHPTDDPVILETWI